MYIVLDGTRLTCAQVFQVASAGARVEVGTTDRARAAWRAAASLTGPVYGQTTGVGANKDQVVEGAGLDLLRSHAGGAGPLVSADRARATVLVRLNQILAGGSGVHPDVAHALADALNDGFVPPIRTYGAIGTGDLTALSTLALCLMGELPWRRSPPDASGSTSLAVENGEEGTAGPRFSVGSRGALPFISSGAATLADAALACHRLARLLDAAVAVVARSFTAVNASTEPLAPVVHAGRPHPGQATVAARLLRRLATLPQAAERERLQDPYGYRAFPQVHGAAMDALGHAVRTVEIDVNAMMENPLIAEGRAWHNGNFHSAPVALALDALRAAVAQTAGLGVARLATLMEPAYTGLEPFLADRPGRSGALILEYIARDAFAELHLLAAPVTTGSAALSRGVEDHAGFATQAARRALDVVEPLEIALACELVAAVRAGRMRGIDMGLPLDPRVTDRPLDEDLDEARALLTTLAD
ncbi:aromatic amino acid lyase [Streptosporangium soli]|nr:aromatic amino acid lyase [Streptosporangium sp. KLBMP 9127]